MMRRPPRPTRADTLCPYTPLVRAGLLFFHLRRRGLGFGFGQRFGIAGQGALHLRGQLAGVDHLRADRRTGGRDRRSEEHTSELQSLMRISYAVLCLKKKNTIMYETITRKRHNEDNNFKRYMN